MLAHQLAERMIVEFVEHVAEFILIGASLREHSAIMPAQRSDKSVAVLPTYLAIIVAMRLSSPGCFICSPVDEHSTASNMRCSGWIVLPDDPDERPEKSAGARERT